MIDDRARFLDFPREAGLHFLVIEGSESLHSLLAEGDCSASKYGGAVSGPGETYQPGDHVYYLDHGSMALCRVRKVTEDKPEPGFVCYVLEIIEEPYDHEFLKPLGVLNPLLAFYNRFTVCVAKEYNPYGGKLYPPEEYHKYYGHYQGKMERWSWMLTIILCAGVAVIITICLIGAYLIFSGR